MKLIIKREKDQITVTSKFETYVTEVRYGIPGVPKSFDRRGWAAFVFPEILSETMLKFDGKGENTPWKHSDPNIVEVFLIDQDSDGYLWRLNWNGMENRTHIPSLDELHIMSLVEIIRRKLFPADCPNIVELFANFPVLDFRRNTKDDLVF
jgi:hypothetical protein